MPVAKFCSSPEPESRNPRNLPHFRGLVLNVYAQLDTAMHAIISGIPRSACNQWSVDFSGLTYQQAAEVKRFINGDYDVVLGMLERRMDWKLDGKSRVRQTVASVLRGPNVMPAPIHRALMRLSDRGGSVLLSRLISTCFLRMLRRVHNAGFKRTLLEIFRAWT